MAEESPEFLETHFEYFRVIIAPEAPSQFTTSPMRNCTYKNKYFPVFRMYSLLKEGITKC